MGFSSDSDSEDDEEMQKFREAADSTLLTNDLYGKKSDETKTEATSKEQNVQNAPNKQPKKSQRYLPEDEENHFNDDFNLPASVQEHIAKKLSALIEKQVEFYDLDSDVVKTKMKKSKVKLLADSEDYVKTYEEFEYDTKGPQKKPELKRRRIDEEPIDASEQLSQVPVTGESILNGEECKKWSIKPVRPHKLFHYKSDSKGNLTAQETTNEFTQRRRKNKWNESKIKQKIKK